MKLLNKKVVVIGDGGTGKTSILHRYLSKDSKDSYEPTVISNYNMTTTVGDIRLDLSIWDTAGQEDYERLTRLSLFGTQAVIIVFDVTDKTSFNNAIEKWYGYALHHCIAYDGEKEDITTKKPVFILVGNKIDIPMSGVSDMGDTPSTYACYYQKKVDEVNIKYFITCSAKTNNNIKHIFDKLSEILVSEEKETMKSNRGFMGKVANFFRRCSCCWTSE